MMKVFEKHVVVVLGMHRSGTSVVTKALEALGVNLGKNLLIPKDDNVKGFFEDVGVVELNQALLQASGHDWHSLSPVLPDEQLKPTLTSLQAQAADMLRLRLFHTDLFGMKDPRMTRLLPFWQRVIKQLDVRVSYVIACRNPISVARSLEKRNGFDLEKGYLLWLEHSLRSLTYTVGTTRVVVDYDRLMENPVRELRRMASALALDFDPNAPCVKTFEENFLDSSLRHNMYLTQDLDRESLVPDEVKALYEILSSLAEDSLSFDATSVTTELDKIEIRLQQSQSLLRYLRVCDDRNAELRQKIDTLKNDVIQRDVQLAERDTQLVERDTQLVERDTQLVERDTQLVERDALIVSLLNSRSWRLTLPLRSAGTYLREVNALRRAWLGMKSLLRPSDLFDVQFRRIVIWLGTKPFFCKHCKPLLKRVGLDSFLRRIKQRLLTKTAAKHLHANCPSYAVWSEDFDTPDPVTLARLDETASSQGSALVLVFFDNATGKFAHETAQRLVAGRGLLWHAAFFYTGEDSFTLDSIQQASRLDPRILCNKLPLADGSDLLIVMQGGGLPRSHALRCFSEAFHANSHKSLAYCDEDVWIDGRCDEPWLKPEFSPLLAQQGRLMGKMCALRLDQDRCITLVERLISGVATPAEEILNLALISPDLVLHVPHVLFHDAKPSPALPLRLPELPASYPTVSIIIPTRDGWEILEPCLRSLKKTDWPSECLEIIVVDNGSTDRATLEGLNNAESEGSIRLLHDKTLFNWSRLNNLAAKESRGEILVFLNNDTEVLDSFWLRTMFRYLALPSAGAVGCKLLYPDHTVQHGGVVAGIQGVAGHAHLFLAKDAGGYHNLSILAHEVSAVTGACLAVTRQNFDAVGGFDENFRVAFNDTVFCFSLLALGKRNLYVSDPLFIHHESKTRGYDDTPEKVALLRQEAAQAWALYPKILRKDPYYSPNLSLREPYRLSFAPRRKPIWSDSRAPRRILLLSETHAIGHGVPIVLALQAEALRARNYEVIVGGPAASKEILYEGCSREILHDDIEAAYATRKLDIDLVIPHTPLFYGIARWTGSAIPVIAWDHGEPPANFFPDAEVRHRIQEVKRFHLAMASAVVAISQAIRDENPDIVYEVLRNGNSHLCTWTNNAKFRRLACRAKLGWEQSYIVLNVCRFHAAERLYKGVDHYAMVRECFMKQAPPKLRDRTIFVLAGRATEEDVQSMTSLGLTVKANVTDEEMIDLYFAADSYANFSRWEGYNLGIGQALATGLPTVASDIPAHREFGIQTTKDPEKAAAALISFSRETAERTAKVWKWEEPLNGLCAMVDRLTRDQELRA